MLVKRLTPNLLFRRWVGGVSPPLPPLSSSHSPWQGDLSLKHKTTDVWRAKCQFSCLNILHFSILPTLPSPECSTRRASSAWQSTLISEASPLWGSSAVSHRQHVTAAHRLLCPSSIRRFSALQTITTWASSSLRDPQVDLIWLELILSSEKVSLPAQHLMSGWPFE